MDEALAIRRGREILERVNIPQKEVRLSNLLDFIYCVVDVVKAWKKAKRDLFPDLLDFLTTLAKLRDDAERIVSRDPIILYKPLHEVALGFHKSLAMYRYFYGANRITKTEGGYADDAWILTGRHPYRRLGLQGSIFIVGSDYEKYAPMVFETKMLKGEDGNPISPLFPEGGRWLHHYDSKRHIIYVACSRCALANRAQECPHVKYECALFSDHSSELSAAGGQYSQGHLDEPVSESFFNEAQQRITTIKGAGLIITETPKWGEAWWSYQILYKTGIKGPPENWLPDRKIPIVSLHTIDRLTAGLTPVEDIVAMLRTMPDYEIQCRIFGKHVAADETSIFDLYALNEMAKATIDPTRGDLQLKGEMRGRDFEEIANKAYDKGVSISFMPRSDGNLRVYEPPQAGRQYVIGADVAFGLTKGDPSAAIVHQMIPVGEKIALSQAASYHGWIGAIDYANALFRLGLWYNCATLVIESNGPGLAVIQRLFDLLGCWFLFRDVTNPASATLDMAATYGINTNIRTKPMMISVLQSKIKAFGQGVPGVVLRGREEIEEHRSFVQEQNLTGSGFKMKGVGKTHDDYVIANALATYAAIQHPTYDYQLDSKPKKEVQLSEHEKAVWKTVPKDEKAPSVEEEDRWY